MKAKAEAAISPAALPDRLLDAALECFRRLGLSATRIEDIAQAADVSRSAIYRFYPSKRAIQAALLARALQSDESRFAALARAPEQSAPARLEALLLAEAAALQAHRQDRVIFALLQAARHETPDVWAQHRKLMRGFYGALLEEGIRGNIFSQALAASGPALIEDMALALHDPRLQEAGPALDWRPRAEALAAAILRALA